MISVIGRSGFLKTYIVYNRVLFSLVNKNFRGEKNPEIFNNSLLSSFLFPLHSLPKQQKSQNLRCDHFVYFMQSVKRVLSSKLNSWLQYVCLTLPV